eukprot:Rmarinus@m.13636
MAFTRSRISQQNAAGMEELQEKVRVLERDNAKLSEEVHMWKEEKEKVEAMRNTYAAQLESITVQRDELQTKSEVLERLKDAVVSLYIDFKDRSPNPYEKYDLEAERKSLMSQNPVTVVDYLRASLQLLLAFKLVFERELKSCVKDRTRTEKDQILKLENKMDRMLEERKYEHTQFVKQKEQLRDADGQRKMLILETGDILKKLKSDNKKLMQMVRERDQTVETMQKTFEKQDIAIKDRDFRLMRVVQLEHQIENLKTEHDSQLQRLHSQHVSALQHLQWQVAHLAQRDAENKVYEEKLQDAMSKISSYKLNHVRELLSAKDRTIKRLTTDANNSRNLAKQKEAETLKIRALLTEQKRLTEAAKREGKDNVEKALAAYKAKEMHKTKAAESKRPGGQSDHVALKMRALEMENEVLQLKIKRLQMQTMAKGGEDEDGAGRKRGASSPYMRPRTAGSVRR